MLKKAILFLFMISFCLFACKGANDAGGGGVENPPEVDTSFLDKVNAKHKDLVTVIYSPTTVVGSDLPYKDKRPNIITWYSDGVFVKGRTLKLNPYQIGKWEVSYELWTEVLSWALQNGYTFLFQGGAGSESPNNLNKPFIPPTEENKWQPVVWVTWRSAIVWCNAYSEMVGLRPVYYKDAEKTLPIRTTDPCASDDPEAPKYAQVPNDEPGYVDAPFVDWQASGFRLPTEAEWEMAGRGGNPNSSEWGWKYPTCNDDNTLFEYSWIEDNSGGKTHNVGEKRTNKLGIYDMIGNAQEWCFDWFTGNTTEGHTLIEIPWYGPEKRPKDEVSQDINSARIIRGNDFRASTGAFQCTLGYRLKNNPTRGDKTMGFRVARTITTK